MNKTYDFIIEGKVKAKDRRDASRIMIEKLSCKEIASEMLMQFTEQEQAKETERSVYTAGKGLQ